MGIVLLTNKNVQFYRLSRNFLGRNNHVCTKPVQNITEFYFLIFIIELIYYWSSHSRYSLPLFNSHISQRCLQFTKLLWRCSAIPLTNLFLSSMTPKRRPLKLISISAIRKNLKKAGSKNRKAGVIWFWAQNCRNNKWIRYAFSRHNLVFFTIFCVIV